ncbi:MAG: VCBS repeat-containing protein [Pirellulales bacterium]
MRPSLESLEGRRLLAFTTPISYPVGNNPAGIAVGDFNTDGRDDMAVVNNGPAGTISVMISNSDGSFQPAITYPSGAGSIDASAGDMNGDGKVDLVVVGSAVDVLLGNGDGTFGSPVEFAAPPTAHSLRLADFNHDGLLDVGTMNTNSAGVMLGNGDGTLQSAMVTPVAGNNINLVIGDYNRDGNMDMATSNTNSIGTVNVLKGRGDGSFDPAVSYYAFSAPVYLATGDFNHDGYLDFACPNSYAATSMSVLLNNGDGTYGAPHTYGIAQTGYEIEVADFNNDGNEDFAVRGGSMYMISHGKGDGTFYPSVTFPTPNGRFEAGTHGDFNGDGAVDLAYPGAGGVTVVSNDNADAQNLAGAVTFRVEAPATTTSGSVLPMKVSAIDANGNVATGFRGVVYISSNDPLASTASGYAFNPLDAGMPYVFNAADAGTHSFVGAIRLVTAGPQTVSVSAPNMQAGSATVNVTGQVTKLNIAAPSTAKAGDSFTVTVTAINSEGAAASGYSSTVHFSSNDALAGLPADYTFTPEDAGSHSFSVTLKTAGSEFLAATELGGKIGGGTSVNVTPLAATSLAMAGSAGAIGVSRPVTIVARDTYGNLATSYNGTVHFSSTDPAAILPSDTALVNGTAVVNVTFLTVGTQTVTAVDVNDSSLVGTLTSDATPPVPAAFRISGYPNSIAGDSGAFTVTVIDTIGQTASGFNGTVYFSSSDVQAGLPAAYTFTTADAGVHSFAATLKTAGLQSISARDAFSTLVGSQAGINISPAAFNNYDLSVPNGADSKGHILVTAGETISLTVKAVDAFGNSISGYTGTVHLSSTDTTAALPSDYTFSAADAGSHTFAVELRTATPNGIVWSFNVNDVATPAFQAVKTNFEVVNGAAASYKLTMPTKITAGVPFTLKVTALDAFGNTAKNYFGTVHFATSSQSSSLPADYSFDNTDAGVHDFLVSLNTSGLQSLSLVDAQNRSVIGSETGDVTASNAVSFSVATPSGVAAGQSASVTVTARDAFGNIAVGYRGTVSLSSSDATAVLPAAATFSNNDAGIHVFSVTFKTAGKQSVNAVDTVDGSIIGSSSNVNVTPGSTAGSFVVSGYPATTAGTSQSFTVRVKDTFGNSMTNYTGTVTFSSSDAQAGLPTSYTFTATDAGVHSFAATLKTAGAQSITVKDSSGAATGTQSGISVAASSVAGSIAVSGYPATVAGVAQNFTVTVRDLYGNISNGYQGTVSFSSSDAKAGLPAAYTFTSADSGVHSFSAALKTAGTQSITVRDANIGTILGTQNGIVVTAAAAASLKLSAPASATSGQSFNFTVTAYDAFGNIAVGYRGKIQMTSTDSKAGSSSSSFGTKDNGVLTTNYKFSTLGQQTMRVVDTANPSLAVSVVINVVAKV